MSVVLPGDSVRLRTSDLNGAWRFCPLFYLLLKFRTEDEMEGRTLPLLQGAWFLVFLM